MAMARGFQAGFAVLGVVFCYKLLALAGRLVGWLAGVSPAAVVGAVLLVLVGLVDLPALPVRACARAARAEGRDGPWHSQAQAYRQVSARPATCL